MINKYKAKKGQKNSKRPHRTKRASKRRLNAKQVAANQQAAASAFGHFQAGRLEAARQQCIEVLDLDHRHIDANFILGLVYIQSERGEEAESQFRKVLKLKPKHVETYYQLGQMRVRSGAYKEAIDLYKRGLELQPEYFLLRLHLGNVYIRMDRLEEAVECFKKLLDMQPPEPEGIYLNIAGTYRNGGRMEEAKENYRRALALKPDFAEAHEALAMIKKHIEYDKEVQAMERLYETGKLQTMSRLHLSFGLGKAYNDLGDSKRAFECWLEGNTLARTIRPYDSDAQEEMFEQIKQVFNCDFLSSKSQCGINNTRPIFIVGMPRTGTSLTEQILASHPQVVGAGELIILERFRKRIESQTGEPFPKGATLLSDSDWQALGEEYIREQADKVKPVAENIRYISDKHPLNFFFLGMISIMLPEAKIIHCRRHPLATGLSIFQHHFPAGHFYGDTLEDLGRFYLGYQRLMDYWEEQLPGKIYHLQYEELVGDTEVQTRKLLDFCGLPFDPACLRFYDTKRAVATASVAQVREPIYQQSVKGWQRYAEQLAPMRRILGL